MKAYRWDIHKTCICISSRQCFRYIYLPQECAHRIFLLFIPSSSYGSFYANSIFISFAVSTIKIFRIDCIMCEKYFFKLAYLCSFKFLSRQIMMNACNMIYNSTQLFFTILKPRKNDVNLQDVLFRLHHLHMASSTTSWVPSISIF